MMLTAGEVRGQSSTHSREKSGILLHYALDTTALSSRHELGTKTTAADTARKAIQEVCPRLRREERVKSMQSPETLSTAVQIHNPFVQACLQVKYCYD